ncbi:bifunctional DNA-formamidopyrimidine glycosylase/DNA-(apurinic or apyrimidinic site) lyase [Psychrosphaera sp. F3M07]|uniref:bifunctional DNA-formamidopyrimidine glycosylase/DNA-(apurinic or apyrimidinic site) lyase n=1 Tax=Psychrosphaera sp. F3M07 TaxID=2841560 RepID=UPI001C09DF04|nr:bifunctional DNA-formamidopyrimidine glycosylase/DNA-(apurinic or apyrimidinic site) lyase [Psychrosphaera sp. F3M07]MBU2916954.1 bifunctional DNA-formamidopyrimidine glycosylase/DNA-(apurinic or apyrimidinic site) lyase [Psychrosphaera sp. F3M07]
MPELPEVEVSRLGITPHIENQIITQVVVRNGQLRWPVPEEVQLLVGQTVMGVSRRAKYLFIDTQAGSAILHLGMSGKLCVVDKDVALVKHDHIDIEFSNGKVLRYNDPRRFGAFLWQQPNTTHALLTKLGPEPLTDEFDSTWLFEKSRGKSTVVKNFIMDNHVVVGVGNIYANESLFKAGIDPRKPAGKISKQKYVALTAHIKQTLAEAIKQGGTTLKDFTQSDGNPGYFAQELLVYGRAGKACLSCDSILKSIKIGQRNSFYCPSCQH